MHRDRPLIKPEPLFLELLPHASPQQASELSHCGCPWGQHCEGSEAAGALDSSTLSWAPEALTKSSEGFVIFRDLRNVVA